MNKRRRGIGSEINLTPLLDVLFSILFIVMMTGKQNQDDMREQHQTQVVSLREQVQDYKEQIDTYESKLATYELVRDEIVVVTITNTKQEDGHYLSITQGNSLRTGEQQDTELDNIKMGADKLENLKTRLNEILDSVQKENEGHLIYIVFVKRPMELYTYEADTIDEILDTFEKKHETVFMKKTVMDDNGDKK